MLRRAALLAFALLLVPSVLAAAEPKFGWEGFGPGSYTLHKMTTKTEMPGAAVPEQAMEMRQTLVRVTETDWVVKTETKIGGQWMPGNEMTIPRKAPTDIPGVKPEGQKPEELGTEELTIEGKKYSTKKTRLSVAGGTVTSWTSAEEGTLKTETAAGGNTSTMEVTALAKKVQAAGREFTCREMKMTASASGSKTTTTMLMSSEVPMGIVRSETTNDMGAMKMKQVMELMSFEKKPAE
jgi:hypothetical protein